MIDSAGRIPTGANEDERRAIRERLTYTNDLKIHAGTRRPAHSPQGPRLPGPITRNKGEKRMNENARNYLSTRQAAEWLGLSPRTLDRYRVTGEGPVFHRFGSRVRYLLADLEAWAKSRRRASTSDDGVAAGRMTR